MSGAPYSVVSAVAAARIAVGVPSAKGARLK